MQGKRQSVIVELLHKTVRKELTLRGNYNTGYEVLGLAEWSEKPRGKSIRLISNLQSGGAGFLRAALR